MSSLHSAVRVGAVVFGQNASATSKPGLVIGEFVVHTPENG